MCNDITRYCRNIERTYDGYGKNNKTGDKPREEEMPGFFRMLKKKKAEKSAVNSFEDRLLKNCFIREIKHEIHKYLDFGNILTIKLDAGGAPQTADYLPPPRTFLKSAINKHHKVWAALAKKHSW